MRKRLLCLLTVALTLFCVTTQTLAMQIFVKPLEGSTITIEVDSNDKLPAIKAKILEKTGIGVEQQILTFNGVELTDNTKTLSELGIKKEDTICLTINANSKEFREEGAEITILATYDPDAWDDVISVDIAWEAMDFVWAAGGSTGEWQPETHTYLNPTDSGVWQKEGADITLTNHSNVAVTAAMSFAAADGLTTTGSFSAAQLELAAGQKDKYSEAESRTTTFTVGGGGITEDTTIGTITVSISKAIPGVTDLALYTYGDGYYWYYDAGTGVDWSKLLFDVTWTDGSTTRINGATEGVVILPDDLATKTGDVTWTSTASYGGKTCQISVGVRAEPTPGGLPWGVPILLNADS